MTDQPAAEPTPGPWKACHDGECPCGQIWSIPSDVPVATVVGDKKHLVALVHDDWGDDAELIYGSLGREAQRANARLIANAPATAAEHDRLLAVNEGLMALLQEALPHVEQMGNELATGPVAGPVEKLADAMGDAILVALDLAHKR